MKLFPSRCYNGGLQHRFKARHTKTRGQSPLPDDIQVILFYAGFRREESITAALRGDLTVYVGDVCIWCGTVVNQPLTKGS